MNRLPTIVTIPCFSGAPWELDTLTPLSEYPLRTMRLPEGLDTIEAYADFVAEEIWDLVEFVLVGDSFGAVIALALAVRQPQGLRALVLSGGFAENPVTNPFVKAKLGMAKFLPGPLYRELTLRFHAASLSSAHDIKGQVPWTKSKSRQLFLENTPWRSYVSRAKAAFSARYREQLNRIEVPTLILTPDHDTLIGPKAARIMLDGIPDSEERVLPETGHMFRFSHPETYANEIREFLEMDVFARQFMGESSRATAAAGL